MSQHLYPKFNCFVVWLCGFNCTRSSIHGMWLQTAACWPSGVLWVSFFRMLSNSSIHELIQDRWKPTFYLFEKENNNKLHLIFHGEFIYSTSKNLIGVNKRCTLLKNVDRMYLFNFELSFMLFLTYELQLCGT